MSEVVAGHVATQLREDLGDRLGVLRDEPVDHAMYFTDPARERLPLRERRLVHPLGAELLASEQDTLEREDVFARAAVNPRALAARVGRDHAADGRAARR